MKLPVARYGASGKENRLVRIRYRITMFLLHIKANSLYCDQTVGLPSELLP